MPYYVRETELFHHGIMKQKWGRRNGPPYPLKNAERSSAEKSANKESKSSKEKKSSGSGSGGSGSSSSKKSTKSTEKSSSSSKSGSKEKKKSKHRTNLEEKYKENGMSASEAKKAANKRINVERFIAVAAGVAVVGTAAYVVYRKNGKKYADKVIKEGTNLQRIAREMDASEAVVKKGSNVSNPFYASANKMDNLKYKGWYGQQITKFNKDAYKINMSTTKNIKVASQTNATKVFQNLYNTDSTFRSQVNTLVPDAAGSKYFFSGNMTNSEAKKAYESFNRVLYKHTSSNQAMNNTFYSKLKSMGYSAINDINDMKYSGYHSSNPLIVFDTKSTAVNTVEKLAEEEINNAANLNYLIQLGEEAVVLGGGGTAAAVGIKKLDEKLN